MIDRIAVIGMWHLGCSIVASWLRLNHTVTAIDLDPDVVNRLRNGHAPVFEPGVDEEIASGLKQDALWISSRVAGAVAGCPFVFIAFDTPVADDDISDLSPIRQAIKYCGPHLDQGAVVIVSSQLPVGTARELRALLRTLAPTAELVYSPENLQLGQAIDCYLHPGHIVIGSESIDAADQVEALFSPMEAKIFRMNLPSAELAKHCINSFLATSVTLANQWSDIAEATGADYSRVAEVLRADHRIGKHAYITPGIGFSGGTLGRDLRVLDSVNHRLLDGSAPIFGQVWEYNVDRIEITIRQISRLVDGLRARRITLLGMTYKPGTSTMRRSLPLVLAQKLLLQGAIVTVHDPQANWKEAVLPSGLIIADSVYDAVIDADLTILLTEWPEYRELDFKRLSSLMNQPLLFDTKDFLQPCKMSVRAAGICRMVQGQGDL